MIVNGISTQNLQEQSKYYSYIICKTRNINLCQKFPFHVVSLNGKIHKPSQNDQNTEQFEYNFSFDCAHYLINGKKLIIGQGYWLLSLIDNADKQLIERYEFINYQTVKMKKQLKFYYYDLKSHLHIQLVPSYVLFQDCIIFQHIQHINNLQFKQISNRQNLQLQQYCNKNQQIFGKNFYSFTCQYAIMSDTHFMGSLIRKYRPTSVYVKSKHQQLYYHFILKQILNLINKIYPSANL